MLIWINGAFGAGKTDTAYELHRRLGHSHVFDPEHAGFYIQASIPDSLRKSDFQHYPLWRQFNYEMLSFIVSQFEGTVIVPMTIVDPQYFAEIVGRLRADGVDVRHYTLVASREVLIERLLKRGESRGSWGERQIERCVTGLVNPIFSHHIPTDKLTIADTAEYIAGQCGLKLMQESNI